MNAKTFARIKTLKGQNKKLLGFCGIWSHISYTSDHVSNGKLFVNLFTYNGKAQQNLDYIEKLKKVVPFPDAIKVVGGHLQYAPEIKTQWLIINLK